MSEDGCRRSRDYYITKRGYRRERRRLKKEEIAPGKEGLVHISKLDEQRVARVEDVVSVGDIIPVKVIKISEKGIDLSRKDAIAAIKAAKKED